MVYIYYLLLALKYFNCNIAISGIQYNTKPGGTESKYNVLSKQNGTLAIDTLCYSQIFYCFENCECNLFLFILFYAHAAVFKRKFNLDLIGWVCCN